MLELTTLVYTTKEMSDQSVGFIGDGGNKIILEVEEFLFCKPLNMMWILMFSLTLRFGTLVV